MVVINLSRIIRKVSVRHFEKHCYSNQLESSQEFTIIYKGFIISVIVGMIAGAIVRSRFVRIGSSEHVIGRLHVR